MRLLVTRLCFASFLALVASLVSSFDALAQTAGAVPGGSPFAVPKYERYAAGLLARSVFQAIDPQRRYRAEVWGLLVGPGQRSEEVSLPGDAVLLVRAGRGMISINGKNQELALGRAVTVQRSDKFLIENFDPHQAISIRATIVRAID
jgi:hypothetical protein